MIHKAKNRINVLEPMAARLASFYKGIKQYPLEDEKIDSVIY